VTGLVWAARLLVMPPRNNKHQVRFDGVKELDLSERLVKRNGMERGVRLLSVNDFSLMRTTEYPKAHYQSYPYKELLIGSQTRSKTLWYYNMKNKYYNHKVKCCQTPLM
jgi:hypothetical protein